MDSLGAFVVIGCVFAFAGFVKGVVSVGLPTVIMGLLGTVLPPAQAAALLVVPAIATNVWQFFAGPNVRGLARRFATMMLATVAGTLLSIGLLTGATPRLSLAALGAVLALYGLYGLLARPFSLPPRLERAFSPAIGLVTGTITGATGVFVVPSVPYLSALDLSKDELVQVVALAALVASITLGAALAWRGAYPFQAAWTSAIAVLPALAGMYIGQTIRSRLRPEIFRRWFFAALVALGTTLVIRSLTT